MRVTGLFAQENFCSIIGQVSSVEENKAIRFASVSVNSLKKGGITNSEGKFSFKVPKGRYLLRASIVGYKTETLNIDATGDSVIANFKLTISSKIKSDVVVYAEEPAVRLMRKIIARKNKQADSLQSYTCMLYTKFVSNLDTITAGRSSGRSDTTTFAIFESFSKGYFSKPDNYFNEIIQRRQTANIPSENNFVVFGTNINCYENFVTLVGEEIATPFNTNAIDFYDFKFDDYYDDDPNDNMEVRRIKVTPKTKNRRLFSGFIDVDSLSCIPLYSELSPNEAVQLPLGASLLYKQKFDLIDNKFVLPNALQITSSLKLDLLWIFAPRIDITIENLPFDYQCNLKIDADVFQQRRVEANENADKYDSIYWKEKLVMPLRASEEAAYKEIEARLNAPDSLKNGNSIFNNIFGDFLSLVSKLNEKPFTGYSDIFRYNRIHGAYTGIGFKGEEKYFNYKTKFGYGFSDKIFYSDIALTFSFDEKKNFLASLNAYNKLLRRDNPFLVTHASITPVAFLSMSDYGDYYYAKGFEAAMEYTYGRLRFIAQDQFARSSGIKLFFKNEAHSKADVNTTWSLFGADSARSNPPAVQGVMRSLGFELRYNYRAERRISDFGFSISGEYSNPKFLDSDFDFSQINAALILRTRTLPLWKLDLRLSAGTNFGLPPTQKFYSLESSNFSIAGEAAFRGMKLKEFYGDRFAALSLEHNFGEVIPGLLRIPNIASFGIEFLIMGRLGFTDFSESTKNYFIQNFPTYNFLTSTAQTPDKIYLEAGLGINRIILFLRFDISARLSQTQKPIFNISLSGATN